MLLLFYKKLFLPWCRGQTTLEIDNEKVQYFVKRKTVLWKDVDYRNTGGGRNGVEIRFSIKGSPKDVLINTQYVWGMGMK